VGGLLLVISLDSRMRRRICKFLPSPLWLKLLIFGRPALVVVICTQGVTVLHVLKNFWVYSRNNRRADRGEVVIEGQEGFRHTL
jgi:hypothetical protein